MPVEASLACFDVIFLDPWDVFKVLFPSCKLATQNVEILDLGFGNLQGREHAVQGLQS